MNRTKKTFWAAFLFYFFIAFEFAYMAGPFAAFFYSVYSPALKFFNSTPLLAWLIQFFLPHVVQETTSPFISVHNIFGAMLAVAGFSMFLIGAIKIYYSKLAKNGAVTGGIYKYIRHPQYLSFMVCSFGLLIIWPRYIVLISFVTMIFVYYFLARSEESECCQKFGESYISYMKSTNMFIPFIKMKRRNHKVQVLGHPISKGKRIRNYLCIYVVTIILTILIAFGLQKLTVDSLYSRYESHDITISLCKLDEEQLGNIHQTIMSDEKVRAYLKSDNNNTYYLNYILPVDWFAAEVPMNGYVYRKGHSAPADYDRNEYKMIITRADLRKDDILSDFDFLRNVVNREGVVEVWVDMEESKVIQVLDMPEAIKYEGIPEAIY